MQNEPIVEQSQTSADELQVWRYWQNCIKRSIKAQPKAEWEKATKRLKAESYQEKSLTISNEPYVNGFRQHYEALKSFLDQADASFSITPTQGLLEDPVALKHSEADSAYLRYIWDERKCQPKESKKLDSAIVKNLGVTMPCFNRKTWMPFLKTIPAENFLFDPDCHNIRDEAQWEGYFEYITVETLKAQNPKLTEAEIDEIKKVGGNLLDEKDKKETDENDQPMFNVICVYHIFARNDAAIRKMKDDKEQIPGEEELEKLIMTTPRRYIKLCGGYQKPLLDEEGWPYDLDDDEFPTTILSFNTPSEDLYGFTDYKQMKRLDDMCDNIFADVEKSAYWAARKKFGGTPEAEGLAKTIVDNFLNDPKTSYLPNVIDSTGKQKLQEIVVSAFNAALVDAVKLTDQMRDKASSLGELVSETAAEYKDVTAIAARIHDANIHQRVNRRLGGPEGYEKSITEDATKLLEIAHQYVPRFSEVLVNVPKQALNPKTDEFENTGETYPEIQSLPWLEATQAMQNGGKLIKLGVDVIIGQELALSWRTADEVPSRVFKLSTTVRVVPGSTRQVTQEQRAAMLKQYYQDIYSPLYETLGRRDLAVKFLEKIGNLIGLGDAKTYLPNPDEAKVMPPAVQGQSAAALPSAAPLQPQPTSELA